MPNAHRPWSPLHVALVVGITCSAMWERTSAQAMTQACAEHCEVCARGPYCLKCEEGFTPTLDQTKCEDCGQHCSICDSGRESCLKCEHGYARLRQNGGYRCFRTSKGAGLFIPAVCLVSLLIPITYAYIWRSRQRAAQRAAQRDDHQRRPPEAQTPVQAEVWPWIRVTPPSRQGESADDEPSEQLMLWVASDKNRQHDLVSVLVVDPRGNVEVGVEDK